MTLTDEFDCFVIGFDDVHAGSNGIEINADTADARLHGNQRAINAENYYIDRCSGCRIDSHYASARDNTDIISEVRGNIVNRRRYDIKLHVVQICDSEYLLTGGRGKNLHVVAIERNPADFGNGDFSLHTIRTRHHQIISPCRKCQAGSRH